MAEVIPGFAARFDIPNLLTCFTPRRVLIVSATDDLFSHDAERVVVAAQARCVNLGRAAHTTHNHYEGDRAVTQERFDAIVRGQNHITLGLWGILSG